MADTCLSCQHWQPKKSGPMAKQGFALCALGSLWCYLAPHHSCKQFKEAEAEVVAARRKWLGVPC